MSAPPVVVTPEYLAEDISGTLMSASITFIALEFLVLVLFLVSRCIKKPADRGDMLWLMLFAFVFCEALAIIGILSVKYGGVGRHMLAVNKATITRRYKMIKAVEFLYIPAVTFPKLAMLRLYMRLFTSHRSTARYVTYATGAVIILVQIYAIIAFVVSCRPFAYNWDKGIPGGKCWDIMANYRWVSFPNILTDVVLMALSLPAIWKLKIPLTTKVSLLLTFALGSVGFAISIVRFVEFFSKNIFVDITFYGANTMLWSLVEPGTYFIAAALLTIRPLLRLNLKGFKTAPVESYTRSMPIGGIGTNNGLTINEMGSENGGNIVLQSPKKAAFGNAHEKKGFVRLEDLSRLHRQRMDIP